MFAVPPGVLFAIWTVTSVLFTLRFPAILWISIISKERRVAP
eukprot:COSAG02_NODE_60958_length_270_cov_0.491228_1_plen_41_part_10